MFEFLKKKIKKFEDQIESEVEEELRKEEQKEKAVAAAKEKKKAKAKTDEKISESIEGEVTREAEIQEKVAPKTEKEKKRKKPVISDEKIDELLWDLEVGLLEADVALSVIDSIKENIKQELHRFNPQKKSAKKIVEQALQNAITNVLESSKGDFYSLLRETEKPAVVMFIGVNGGGKTTAIAKTAYQLKQKGKVPVMAAGDTFRAGAIEQLQEHGNRIGVNVIKHSVGSDPAAVAYDAIQHAEAKHKDVVLLDTAGRMQTNRNLMEEMEKIKRVAKPDIIIFVGDALSGNDAVEQARRFDEAVGIDGVILTKVDADAKGGSALSIAYTIGKPLLFIGVGQEYEDQIQFDPHWMLEHIFEE